MALVKVEKLKWTDVPFADTGALRLTLGLGSGLSRRAGDPPGRVFAVTDRGPNLFVSTAVADYGLTHLAKLAGIKGAKVMPLPERGPEIVELRVQGSAVHLVQRIPLCTRTRRLSGLPLPGCEAEMEDVFGMDGGKLPSDLLGADTEAIAAGRDGGFWLAEEYGPSLLKADASGVVSERWVPAGRENDLQHSDLVVRGVLPKQATRRRANRGIEGLAVSDDGARLYMAMQSGLIGEASATAPVWRIDARTGETEGEWAYPFDEASSFRRDAGRRTVTEADLKISELTWIGEDRLIVQERIAHTTKLYAVTLSPAGTIGKALVFSTDDFPEIDSDIEGVAMLSPKELLLVTDNDFGVEGAHTAFWRVTVDAPLV